MKATFGHSARTALRTVLAVALFATGLAGPVFPLVTGLTSTPEPSAVGGTVEVVLLVTNDGASDVDQMEPFIQVNLGDALLTPVTAPPAGPYTLMVGNSAAYTWTFDLVGNGLVEFTGTAVGNDTGTSLPIEAANTYVHTVGTRADILGFFSVFPAEIRAGDPFTIRLTLSNSGDEPAVFIVPELELVSGLTATILAGPVPSSTIVLWGFAPPAVFTWSCSVTGAGILGFSATGTGIRWYDFSAVSGSTTFEVSVLPRAGLSATLWASTASPSLGNWFYVIMTVSNTGKGPADVLVPFLDANVSAGVAEYILGPVPASATILQAGQGVAFTWTYSVTGIGDLAFTGTVTATDAYTGAAVGSATSFMSTAVTKGKLVTTVTATPNPALFGGGITVTMRVTNNGLASVTGITATMLVESGSSLLVPYRSPPAMGPLPLASGANTRFVWTYTAAGIGSVTFAATASGTDMSSGLPVWTTTLSGMSIVTGARLESLLFNLAFPAAPYGSWIDEVLMVYNAGTHPALSVTPDLEVTSLGSTVYLAVAPAAVTVNLAPGAYHFYTWTYSVTGAGQVDFSTTVTAVDQLSGYGISTSTAGSLYTRYRAILSCTTYVLPEPAFVGQTIATRTVVTNKGTETAWLISPTMRVLNGGQCVSLVTGPSMAIDIPPGMSTTMYWDHLAVKSGVFQYVTSMDGLDPAFGTLYAESGESVAILKPGALSATLSVVPSSVSVGQWIRVIYTVTNSGDAPVGVLNALEAVGPGAALLDFIDGPAWLPFMLAPGAATTFTWTWSVSGRGAGVAAFTVTGTGTDSALGLALSAPKTARLSIASPSLLSTSMYVLSATAKQGSEVTVLLTVTNIGEATATNVKATWFGSTLWDGSTPVAGPLPPGPVTLAAGQATTFSWTWRVATFPSLEFTASVAGRDLNTGYEISATAVTTPLGVSPAPFLLLSLVATPASPRQGDPIEVTVTVSNTGEAAANGVFPVLSG